MRNIKKFAEYLPFVFISILLLFMIAILVYAGYIGFVGKSAFLIIRAPDGSIVEGYGRYTRFSDTFTTVTIDGVTYKTSYDNVLIVEQK